MNRIGILAGFVTGGVCWGVLLINLFIFILPRFLGDSGIWMSYPLAELVTLGFSVIFIK